MPYREAAELGSDAALHLPAATLLGFRHGGSARGAAVPRLRDHTSNAPGSTDWALSSVRNRGHTFCNSPKFAEASQVADEEAPGQEPGWAPAPPASGSRPRSLRETQPLALRLDVSWSRHRSAHVMFMKVSQEENSLQY